MYVCTQNKKMHQKECCDVKDVFKCYGHKKCTCSNRRKYASKVTGSVLNSFILNRSKVPSAPPQFRARKHYHICSNLCDTIKHHDSPSITNNTTTTATNATTKSTTKSLQQCPLLSRVLNGFL